VFENNRIRKNGMVRARYSRDFKFIAGTCQQILIEGFQLRIVRDKIGAGESVVVEPGWTQEEAKNDTCDKTHANCYDPSHHEQNPKPNGLYSVSSVQPGKDSAPPAIVPFEIGSTLF